MTGKTPFFARLSCGLSTTLLALSLMSGVSAVGAESEDSGFSWRETLVIPIMNALHEVHDRLASLEANVALLAGSFASRQITTNELCVADHRGAQTCITKAQLDALLAMMASAAVEPAPAATELKQSIAVETEGHASAALEPTPVITEPKEGVAVLETEAKGTISVESEAKTPTGGDPVEPDTTAAMPLLAPAVAPEPVTIPEQRVSADQQTAPIGSVFMANSGAAVAWYPEVEISIPKPIRPPGE